MKGIKTPKTKTYNSMADQPVVPDVCEACQSLRPATPPPEACCGSGCSVCVYDIHDQEVQLWKKSCLRRHTPQTTFEMQDDDPLLAAMDPTDYRSYHLDSVIQVCENTAIYRFRLPSGMRLDLSIAKHVILRGQFNGKVITRQYTPISPPETAGYFDVLIKLYEHGEMSQYIRQWKVGDHIEWRGTFGSFTHQPNQVVRILMLAAGTGITPIVQVLRHIVDDETDETTVKLLYACKSYPEILLRKTLNELGLFWNVSIVYVLSQDSPDSHHIEYGENVHYGRITKDMISKELELASTTHMRALICGTRSFEDDMIGFFREGGLSESNISKF